MLPETGLTLLIAAIPAVMYAFTQLAIKLGPNPFVGFRISSSMKDEALWLAVHRSLLPLLAKQMLLSITALPVIVALVALPSMFALMLISLIVVMLTAVGIAIHRAYKEIGLHGN